MNTQTNYFSNSSSFKNDSEKKKRISKNPEERKREILNAAIDLFIQKGYSNTTIQDISEYLNISQGLCYRYFKSKSELFTAASEYYALSASEKLSIPFEDHISSTQKMDFLLKEMYLYIKKSNEFDSILYSEGQNKISSEVQLTRLKNFSYQLSSVLNEIIQQGIQEHIMFCDNIDITAQILVNGMIFTYHSDIQKEKDLSYPKRLIISIRNLLINSLQIKDISISSNEWYQTIEK